FDAEGFKLAAERIMGLYSQIHDELGYTLKEIDLGGGYGIPYTAHESALDIKAVSQDLLTAVANTADELGIEPPVVLVELGRALVDAGAVTGYEVGVIQDGTTGDSETQQRR